MQTAGSAKFKSKGGGRVDESLFSASATKPHASAGVAIVTKAQLAAALGPVGNVTATAAVLSATDIERMRASSRLKSWDEERAEMRASAEALAARKSKANERKAYMLRQEEERKKNVPLTDLEKADLMKRASVLTNAALKLAEGIDDVKQMNQMAALAKTMTIRDMQLDEKKE